MLHVVYPKLTPAVSLGIIITNKELVTQNPFKTVYGVIKYAVKHKSPRLRSDFTYAQVRRTFLLASTSVLKGKYGASILYNTGRI